MRDEPPLIAVDARLAPLVEGSTPLDGASPALRRALVVVLEGADAWERLRRLRLGGVRAAAVLVTTADAPPDRARLEPATPLLGTDGLAAAVAAARTPPEAGAVTMGGGVLDRDRGRFRRDDGSEVELTTLEARLLAYLATRPGRAIDRDELQHQVWDHRRAVPTKTVDMTVARLRKKIEPDPAHPTTLLTVRGGGYRVVPGPAAVPVPPPPLGGFVGREALLRRLAQVQPDAPIALVGPAGVGKSRLTVELARRYPGAARRLDLDGAAGVPLATALATAAGLPVVGEPTAGLLRGLAGVELLLVDHADDHADELGALLPLLGERGIRTIAALRRAPAAPGTTALEVPPLSTDEAVQLLTDRSGTRCEAAVAARLVEQLDHLPLAIELAASRLPGLGEVALSHVLEREGRGWLEGGAGRHASLGAAIDGSWRRLSSTQQRALAALTLFRGAFSVADGAAVFPGATACIPELCAHHLVAPDPGGLRVLHAVRDHAAAALPDAVEAAVSAYVACIRSRAAAARAGLQGFEGRAAFAALTALAPELAHALTLAKLPRDVAELTLALDRLRLFSGTVSDRTTLLERAVPRTADDPTAHAQVLLARAAVEGLPHDTEHWLALAQACATTDPGTLARTALTETRQVAMRDGPARALDVLRSLDQRGFDPVWCLRLDAERTKLEIFLGATSHREGSEVLGGIVEELAAHGALLAAVDVGLSAGFHWTRSDPARAVALLERLSVWADAAHDTRRRIDLAMPLAEAHTALRQFARAEQVLDDALRHAERIQPAAVMQVRLHRGDLAASAGRLDEARRHHEDVLATMRRRGNPLRVYGACEALAVVETEARHPHRAVERAVQAVDAAEQANNPHLVHHAHLLEALVRLAHGDATAGRAALERVDPAHLTDLGAVQWAFARVVASLQDGVADPPAWARLDALPDTLPAAAWRPRVLELVAAGRAGDLATLRACAAPETEASPDLRLLARLWLAAPA